jgi:hypothetical protein
MDYKLLERCDDGAIESVVVGELHQLHGDTATAGTDELINSFSAKVGARLFNENMKNDKLRFNTVDDILQNQLDGKLDALQQKAGQGVQREHQHSASENCG